MNDKTLSGTLLDEYTELSLSDLRHACSQRAEWIIELVEEGVLEPTGSDYKQWRFSVTSLHRARTAMRLQRDLGINLAGIAVALDLLDEVETLRARLRRLNTEEDT
jgi:chaperone modulatory protein CbpM